MSALSDKSLQAGKSLHSDTSSQAAESSTAGPGRSAGAGTIIGIALALMLLAALVAVLIAFRGGPIDGPAQLESAFGVRTLGPGYEIVEARKKATGARYLVFEQTSAQKEPEKAAPDSATPKSDAEKSGNERVDWTRVAIPPATAPPRSVTFLFPSEGASHEAVAEFFRNVERKSLSDLGPEGGKVTIGSGKLAWRGFDADWVHERAYEKGGTFRDCMRVDVSLQEQPCVMTAIWTRGESASRETLDRLLETLGTK